METTDFTWIIAGKKRDHFRGMATLKHLGYLEGMEKFKNLLEHVRTEVVPASSAHSFPCVELIDTPGLTDGDLVYPFDIDNIIPVRSGIFQGL